MRYIPLLILPLLISACGTAPKDPVIGDANTLFSTAETQMQEEDYTNAIHTFEELERQHPYSELATQAQMMVAFAHLQNGDADEAALAAERFIRLHPGHKDLPYLFYIRGLGYYKNISEIKRDQGATRKAKEAFEELLNRYPNSEYARDAKQKLLLITDHLAGKEMDVGRYYQKQEQYLAAINRFNEVIEKYQTSSHTPEALMRLTECYISLGIKEEAERNAAILGYNYPSSDFYKRAYNLLTDSGYADKSESAESWSTRMKEKFNAVKEVF